MKRTVILGSGTAGSITANKLARELREEIATGIAEILLFDKSVTSQNQAGFTFVPFGYITKSDLFRKKVSLISPRIRCFFGEHGTIKKIDLENRKVSTKENSYYYDYLVIATGCKAEINIKGLKQDINSFYTSFDDAWNLRKKIASFNGERIVILTPQMPIPCPGAPGKFSILLADYIQHVKAKHVSDKTEIEVLWPQKNIGPPACNEIIKEAFYEKNVSFHNEFAIDSVNEDDKKSYNKTAKKLIMTFLL